MRSTRRTRERASAKTGGTETVSRQRPVSSVTRSVVAPALISQMASPESDWLCTCARRCQGVRIDETLTSSAHRFGVASRTLTAAPKTAAPEALSVVTAKTCGGADTEPRWKGPSGATLPRTGELLPVMTYRLGVGFGHLQQDPARPLIRLAT